MNVGGEDTLALATDWQLSARPLAYYDPDVIDQKGQNAAWHGGNAMANEGYLYHWPREL